MSLTVNNVNTIAFNTKLYISVNYFLYCQCFSKNIMKTETLIKILI